MATINKTQANQIIALIKNDISFPLSDGDWKRLERPIQKAYDNFFISDLNDYANRIKELLERTFTRVTSADINEFMQLETIIRNKQNHVSRALCNIFGFDVIGKSLLANDTVQVSIDKFNSLVIHKFGEEVVNAYRAEKLALEKLSQDEKAKAEEMRSLNNALTYHAKDYIAYVMNPDNADYKIEEVSGAKFTRYKFTNGERYLIAKQNLAYKEFHRIMRYAALNHNFDLLAAIEAIKSYTPPKNV